jgi:hypothetical protein
MAELVQHTSQPLHLWQSIRARLNGAESALNSQDGLRASWILLWTCLALLLLFSRASGLFLHPAFYAEDGAVWYAQAYNSGWLHSLTIPDGGYLNTLQRIGAGVALLVPFREAPLCMMLLGLVVQVLPVSILLSTRCRNWGALSLRAAFAALYVALPNSSEVHVVLTNSQWHLTVSAALLTFACAPKGWAGRVVDALVLVMAGFSGPFCIILLPLTCLFWWVRRQRWTVAAIGCMSIGTLTNLLLLLHHHGDRVQDALGATPRLFVNMVGADILLSGTLGAHLWADRVPFPAMLMVVAGGCVIYGYCILRAPLGLKLFVVFCLLLLPPELKTPLISGTRPLWQLLLDDRSARYWYFPMLAFLWGSLWCAVRAPSGFFRYAGTLMMLATCVGIDADWRYEPFKSVNFPQSARRFEQTGVGQQVVITVMPLSKPPSVMKLVKK